MYYFVQNCMLFLNVAKDYQLFLLTINSLMLLWGCKLVDHSVFVHCCLLLYSVLALHGVNDLVFDVEMTL